LKIKNKQVGEIEAEWSKSQKDIVRSNIGVSDSESVMLAKEQTQKKVLVQCKENGNEFKYPAPVLSQHDVDLMFDRIKQERATVTRREAIST
jgi:hypothetical protein